MHTVHICRGGPDIGNVSRKARQIIEFRNLLQYAFLASGLDEFALMGGYGAEITTPETAPVSVHREFYHIVGRYALALVTGMREFGERQVPERIHLLCRSRGQSRVYLYITLSHRLHDYRRVHHIRISLNQMEILGEGLFVLETVFV